MEISSVVALGAVHGGVKLGNAHIFDYNRDALQTIAGFAQEGLADADALMALMAQDKKVKRGRLTFILLQAIGSAVVANDVEPALVRGFLQQKLSG